MVKYCNCRGWKEILAFAFANFVDTRLELKLLLNGYLLWISCDQMLTNYTNSLNSVLVLQLHFANCCPLAHHILEFCSPGHINGIKLRFCQTEDLVFRLYCRFQTFKSVHKQVYSLMRNMLLLTWSMLMCRSP